MKGLHQTESQLIKWRGDGDCPVPAGTEVIVYLRLGGVRQQLAEYMDWEHTGRVDDIVAYRVVRKGT